MPLMQLKVVVLPAPLGPIRPQICRSSTSKETPATAVTPPKRMTMSWTSSRAMRCPLSTNRRAGARGRIRTGTARATRGGGACNLPEPRHEPLAGLRRLSFLDWEALDRAAAPGASHQTHAGRAVRARRGTAGWGWGPGRRVSPAALPALAELDAVGLDAIASDEVLAGDGGHAVEA